MELVELTNGRSVKEAEVQWKTAPGTKGHSPQSVSDQAEMLRVGPLDDLASWAVPEPPDDASVAVPTPRPRPVEVRVADLWL